MFNNIAAAYFLLGDAENAQVYFNRAWDESDLANRRVRPLFVQDFHLAAHSQPQWSAAVSALLQLLANRQ